MESPKILGKQFEFSFPQLDTLVMVEELDDEVVVRATRGTFSERRKVCFIRELAAEGFISDCYQWFSSFEAVSWLRVRWLTDASWLKLNQFRLACTRRFMIRLLAFAAVLWSAMMGTLLLR